MRVDTTVRWRHDKSHHRGFRLVLISDGVGVVMGPGVTMLWTEQKIRLPPANIAPDRRLAKTIVQFQFQFSLSHTNYTLVILNTAFAYQKGAP